MGASCEDIRLTATVEVAGTGAPNPYAGISLPHYESGKVMNVPDAEWEVLLDRPIPDDTVKIDRNMTLGELKHSRSPLCWLVWLVLHTMLTNSYKQGRPNLNVMFQYNMPLRALAENDQRRHQYGHGGWHCARGAKGFWGIVTVQGACRGCQERNSQRAVGKASARCLSGGRFMKFWNDFAAKHPAAAKWVREGGLFVIVSNLITAFKVSAAAIPAHCIQQSAGGGFRLARRGCDPVWRNIQVEHPRLRCRRHGGLPYFCVGTAIAMVIGECINFPIQRNFVFRSKGNLGKQIAWYVVAFCVITCIVNSINCVWVAVAGLLVPGFIYNIGTTVLNGGVSMVIFFFVNKIIFPESEK